MRICSDIVLLCMTDICLLTLCQDAANYKKKKDLQNGKVSAGHYVQNVIIAVGEQLVSLIKDVIMTFEHEFRFAVEVPDDTI